MAMARDGGKVHVVRVNKTGYVDKQGRRRDYSSAYLRRAYRDGGKVKNKTIANLSSLPAHVIYLINAGRKGQQMVPAAEGHHHRVAAARPRRRGARHGGQARAARAARPGRPPATWRWR